MVRMEINGPLVRDFSRRLEAQDILSLALLDCTRLSGRTNRDSLNERMALPLHTNKCDFHFLVYPD